MASKPQLPDDFERTTRKQFESIENKELPFERFLQHATEEFQRTAQFVVSPPYVPAIGTITPCGNGSLDTGLDPNEWQGGWGTQTIGILGGVVTFNTLTAGILSGPINSPAAHQTPVTAGVDPVVGIPTTAQGSTGAVRIGNTVANFGCELLSKTFIVTPAQRTITFWYAVVLQNPAGHPTNLQPYFQVRVTNAARTVVPAAFDFGNGSDTLSADVNNPFFQTLLKPGEEPIVYKDWSCAQIDLSTMIGQQVTIEFVTADCGRGAHWGYAYVDNFCGNCKGSPTGNFTYDCDGSSHCGPGRICFNYSLPTIGGNTGTLTITLDIYQSGALLTQLTSPVLTSGNSFCFNITPASIPGINLSLGSFDFAASGALAIGTTPLGTIKTGPNDYQIACRTCADIEREQNAVLAKKCAAKVNLLPRLHCDCPDREPEKGDCRCDCVAADFPRIEPCISVSWGDSKCDCLESDDVEVLCVTVCNCYSNVTFRDLTIGQIHITDADGNPVPTLPDGTPSVQVIPSGPLCFGDIPPCTRRASCVSRELVLYTRGAVGKDYRLSFEGVCFEVCHQYQTKGCFVVKVCQD
ncbi:MAG TPA: hypothetical protein VGR02_02850 [Thermoanaerobaculia bacterium]|jgi:hypothetical protein|nr:hypothetical protein [Thermoanaerobaculia bacterium]